MQDSCSICNGATVEQSQFCKRHLRAYRRLESALAEWKVAYGGGLDRMDFLQRLLQLPETGEKAQEVVRFLLEKEP